MSKRVIDVACGSKMFWFDKHNPDVEFCDKREIPYHEYYPHRYIEVSPDTVCDFTALPFKDGAFKLVVFDPPHLTRAGDTSWTALKYGCLKGDWKEMIREGFNECFRVLDPDGVLIFKWSEVQIPLRTILPLSPYPPLFGHRSGKNMNTHWLCFMKPKDNAEEVEEKMDLIAKLVAETATELNEKVIKEVAELKSRLKVIEIINDSEIKNKAIAVMCDLSKPIVVEERWKEAINSD